MRFRKTFGAGMVVAMTLTGGASAEVATPQIKVEPEAGGYSVSGLVLGAGEATVSAEMTIDKAGPSGTMKTRQARTIQTQDGSVDTVAHTRLSAGEKARVHIQLVLTVDGQITAEASSTLDPED